MLEIKNLNKSLGQKTIFKGANLNIGNKINAGLVGINGVGKTTLFNILAGEDKDFEGLLAFHSKHPLIGYMKQQISIENIETSIVSFLKKYTGIDLIENKMNELLLQLENQEKLEEYGEICEIFEKLGGYEFDSKVKKTLNQLGLGKYDIETNLSELSGGEKRKLLLCGTLLKGGDLLLLDEPTNDLDKSSVDGLIKFLKESIASCLVVSHDKIFLNSFVKKIFEIDNNIIIEYSGNYDFYEQFKKEEYEKNKKAYEAQLEEEARIKKTTRELQVKAANISNRGNTKDNDKGDGASKVAKKLDKAAKNIKNRFERIEKIEKPKYKKPLQFSFNISEIPNGGIEIKDILYNYIGNTIFKLKVSSFSIDKNDKLLIYGNNGSGKSTFLKILTGELISINGNIKKNPSLKIGYFSQDQKNLPENISSLCFLNDKLNYNLTDVHQALGEMGFNDIDKNKNIELLSPGMRVRLIFAMIVLRKDNCLIFDEPTNHTDIEIREALKLAINKFQGISIVVSHDNDFINDITFTKKMYFENGVGKEINY